MSNARELAEFAAGYGSGSFAVGKNKIINGAMTIDQRNAGAAVTANSSVAVYSVDRWKGYGTASAGVFTLQQSTTTPPLGFAKFLRVTVTTVDSSLSATDFYGITQPIEGYNISDLGWGASGAKTVTLSFWIRSSVTGEFSGSLNANVASSASYVFTYTVNSANTWEYKTISISGPTSGTFTTDNTAGVSVWYTFAAGSTYSTSTVNSWQAAAKWGSSSSVNVMATLNATVDITGVQLEEGSVATPFENRLYGQELALCQRYFEVFTFKDYSIVGQAYSTSAAYAVLYFTVQKRAAPTATLPPAGNGANQIAFTTSSLGISGTIGTNSALEFSVSKLSIAGTGYTSAFTAGNASIMYGSGNPTVQISAEL